MGGRELRCLVLSKSTKGLWSVSIENFPPIRYAANFSHAQTVARASFSICAYLCSTSVMALDANATGCQPLPSCCSSTAPSPNDEASDDTLVLALGSYNASTVGFSNSSFVALNAAACSAPQH